MSLQLDQDRMKERELKGFLTEIKSGEKNWSDIDQRLVVKSMMKYIGSIDSELRDQLIFTSFYKLIIERNEIEPELLIDLLETCLDDFLFKGIGENGTDTVFTRSFTSLLIALILGRDTEDNFLSQSMVYRVKDELIHYINSEKDLRGYVPEKGWAHSVAHVADTFDELAKNPKISHELYLEMLIPLWNKIFVSESVYVHHEDERLLIPIIEMLNNGLETKEVENLLRKLPVELKAQKEQLEYEKYLLLEFNSKTFLKSFYMKLNKNPKLAALQKSIEQCLTSI
ncbi:DUF2785 domain-containing protein [Fictibacillus barbaricus]|uniref:DUF2785 domain-containing protein n=1 Tax=Fictibacillus barbaricus TaxID=182136 RepID=A0ABU1TWM5_9BACL|nr:DUF2785 domain-containing protein [Fictibacillus barbaricus]MDR7071611.1 hypothetical protein [Fictibacillus barbaricus]